MNKWITVTAVAAVAGFVGLWFKNTRPKQTLSRDTVLEMLRQIDKETFMILCQMAASVADIIKMSPVPPSPQSIKQMFESPESGFPELFQQVYTTLYEQYKTNEDDFEYSIDQGYAGDLEVQFYRKRLAEDFHKAMLGVTPDIDRACPINLKPSTVLQIVKSILDQQIRIFQQGVKLIKEPVPIKSFKDASDQVLRKFKLDIFQKARITGFKDDPERILEFAVATYAKSNTSFGSQYHILQMQYKAQMNDIIRKNKSLFR